MRLEREHGSELMDQPDADREELGRSLADLRRINRWLGARRAAVRRVMEIGVRVPTRPVRVLDVGTGGADIPLALVREGERLRLPVRVVGMDLHPTTVEIARRTTAAVPEVEVVRGDALAIPFADAEFDIAMSHTTLHHFDAEDARRVIGELDRVARWGVVVTDLSRSRAALIGASLLARTVWRTHPITRHDGPRSVRAAFTPEELSALAGRTTSSPFRVRRELLFRLSLVIDRTRGSFDPAGEPTRRDDAGVPAVVETRPESGGGSPRGPAS